MADDGRFTIIIAAPNAVRAVRLVTGPVNPGGGAGVFECCMSFSCSFESSHW